MKLTDMPVADVLLHNQKVRASVSIIKSEYDKQMANLPKFVPPCQYCKYDGVYRCDVCQENGFDGFNVKHYPVGG